MNKKRFFFILDFLIVGIVFFQCSIGFISCEQRFRADVTPYIQDPAADGIYTTARGASLSLPPNELHPLNYNGDTAISKISEKPVMKPAGEKGTFPVLRTHPRGYKDKGNIPIGTKVTLNRLYLERTVMSLFWNKKFTYALYADLTHPRALSRPCLLPSDACGLLQYHSGPAARQSDHRCPHHHPAAKSS